MSTRREIIVQDAKSIVSEILKDDYEGVAMIKDAILAAIEECASIAEEHAEHYPLDVFPEPPPGEHGETVDTCSACAERHAAREIARVIRNRFGYGGIDPSP